MSVILANKYLCKTKTLFKCDTKCLEMDINYEILFQVGCWYTLNVIVPLSQ